MCFLLDSFYFPIIFGLSLTAPIRLKHLFIYLFFVTLILCFVCSIQFFWVLFFVFCFVCTHLFCVYVFFHSSRNVSTIRHDSSSITPATATSNALISPHGTSSVKKTWSHIAKYNRNLTDAGKVKPFNQSSNSIYKYSNDENGIYMYNSKQGYAKRDAIGIGRHNNNNNNFNDEDTMARASQILQ